MLYTEQDYTEISKLRKKLWIRLAAVTLIYTAAVAVCSIIRISWPGYTAAVLWGITVTFIWGMQGSRIRSYYHFLKDIREGLEKSITGTVQNVDTSITSRELIDFYTIIFNDDEANPDSPSRKLYYDASKGVPEYSQGEKLKITLFGNNIKGIEKI